jgi:hypothetical protein
MISELRRMLPVSRGAIAKAKVDGCIISAMRAAIFFHRIVPA